MSVEVEGDEIRLTDRCLAEDADALLVALQEEPNRTVDLSRATRLHLAVVQVLLATRAPVRSMPEQGFAARYLLHVLQ